MKDKMPRHPPKSYIFYSSTPANGSALYAVYFWNTKGESGTTTFGDFKIAKAFAEALDGLGFTQEIRNRNNTTASQSQETP
jgi:hypothetical protein